MTFEKLQTEDEEVFDYCGICPQCRERMTFYHDIKCVICDQKVTMYCPKCEDHYRFKP